MLQRGRPPTRVGDELGCEQGTTSAGHQARRSDEGGRDGGWRLRMAAVAYCEAADRVVNSASPRARLRRGHSTRSWHVIDGIIVNQCVASSQRRVRQQDAYRVFPRDPHSLGVSTAGLRGRTHRVLRARVVFDCAAVWTLLGVRVSLGRRQRRQRRGWLACAGGED